MTCYRQAAETGCAEAQYRLGAGYSYGALPQDDAEAVKWYRLAADQGHARAQHELGWMYEGGLGVAQDFAEAARLYRIAADLGVVGAQSDLGRLYRNGTGVPRDDVEALKWFILAEAASPNDARRDNRQLAEFQMTPAQIEEAQRRASEWAATHPALTQGTALSQ